MASAKPECGVVVEFLWGEISMKIEQIIFKEIELIAAEAGASAAGPLNRETKVFESGLDSLGFAVLVAKLEESLGFDPFITMVEPVYPVTLGEFVEIYAAYQSQQQ